MELGFFEQVGEVARLGVDDDLGEVHHRAHRGGVKLWFGQEQAAREHYEAQLVSNRHVDGTAGHVLEIGFHAEHRDEAANQAAVTRLVDAAGRWRRSLGAVEIEPDGVNHDVVVADRFLGNDRWRRVSETWPDPDLDDPELAFEAGARLAAYVNAFEPILHGAR